ALPICARTRRARRPLSRLVGSYARPGAADRSSTRLARPAAGRTPGRGAGTSAPRATGSLPRPPLPAVVPRPLPLGSTARTGAQAVGTEPVAADRGSARGPLPGGRGLSPL